MTENKDLADALGGQDRGADAGTAGFAWTNETISNIGLSKQTGHPCNPKDTPIQVCAGLYVAEFAEEGTFLHWRFYKDSEWGA